MRRLLHTVFGSCLLVLVGGSFGTAQTREHRFEDYPVKVYQGRHAKPNFKSEPGSYNYRTRIRAGFAAPVNFAGENVLIEIGCGTDCRFGFIANVRTGRIVGLPLGGEENYGLWIEARRASRLLKAWWIDTANDEKWFEHPMCVRQEFVVSGRAFKLLSESKHRVKDQRECFPDEN